MSPVFVQSGGPDVANGTLPEPLGLCGSTKVGFTLIHAFYFEIWFQMLRASMVVKIREMAQFTRATPGSSLVYNIEAVC